ncbi:hypothetical protein [Paraburkholderia sp. XV]|uniref:hypothetical protein n=1 Tax=Paraburkholderia sp. XV TaxID=2831520 RepID=UPI001CD4CFD9|nr:hypothetical protein [Paraburkholderia sp. XV]
MRAAREAWHPRAGALPAQTDRPIPISVGNCTRNTPDHRFGPHDEVLFNNLLEEKWQFIPVSATIGAFGLGIPLMLRAAPTTEPRPLRQNAGAGTKAEYALRAAEYKRQLGWHRCEGILAGAAIATSFIGFIWWFHLLALQMDHEWAAALQGSFLSDPVFAKRGSLAYYLMMCLATELKSWGAE